MERVNTNPHILDTRLKRNRNFPNSSLPVLIYKEAMTLPKQKNKAALIVEKLFAKNGWSNSWKNGIYDFHHFHSNTHECMAVCSGKAFVILGGPSGKKVELKAGDVIILPAGTGHRCIKHSEDFVCVGAYPQGKDYDLLRGKAKEFEDAKKRIAKIPVPMKDPVFGKTGFLKSYWKPAENG
jgi:uncharacterized protein YjlB